MYFVRQLSFQCFWSTCWWNSREIRQTKLWCVIGVLNIQKIERKKKIQNKTYIRKFLKKRHIYLETSIAIACLYSNKNIYQIQNRFFNSQSHGKIVLKIFLKNHWKSLEHKMGQAGYERAKRKLTYYLFY